MAYLELQNLQREFAGGVRALDGIEVAARPGRVPLAARPVGLRQDDRAAPRRRLRPARRGPDRHRRQGHHERRAEQARHGDGVPGVLAVPEHDRGAERRVRPEDPRQEEGRRARAGSPSCSSSSASVTRATAIRTSSPAACSSASRLRARSRSSRACCCSTSRCRRSTRRCACSCARRSGGSSSSSAITTLYVTHDQEEALAVSDHVAVMYRGRIEQIGPPAEMYSRPATPFVAEFIGTMNRLEATIADSAAGTVEHGGVDAHRRRGARPDARRARARAHPPGDRRARAGERLRRRRTRCPAR